MNARVSTKLKKFVVKYEMLWHLVTVTLFAAAILMLVFVFPDVSNLWVSIFVLVGSATAAMTGLIAAIKAEGSGEE